MDSRPEIIKVGIAEMKIVTAPGLIRTTGLGSCVGVILYDLPAKTAGLAHIMLPSSLIARNSEHINKAKFADTAIEELIGRLLRAGCSAHRLLAKIAGGAEMFSFSSMNEAMRIGPRNVEAVKKELKENHIKLVAEDTGGKSGRTIEFNPETAVLTVKTVNHGVIDI
ncbi:chemoreceptor glutamine deamidase CheD [Weizmannia acidilactici]|uniref:Probable chemoreceptor glutamine deamidase CheD n=1 Tax=Weizmannia acidilactici TaxID=2607726 RepID=A0A5J4JAR7_9BACI|nr:chemotaxis protein CheD [Weizmannia acidilactici]GER65647.1 chemoreceptor glutamine deamidase CheD [Weizmannia acidilactici]GER69023.1 chemoreceptor glutamine deamidase CheD [Weizmannia acidilactici]GER72004.1 chemoreceptor glutamine deamidase CheD [Weizmannia acidilactici]